MSQNGDFFHFHVAHRGHMILTMSQTRDSSSFSCPDLRILQASYPISGIHHHLSLVPDPGLLPASCPRSGIHHHSHVPDLGLMIIFFLLSQILDFFKFHVPNLGLGIRGSFPDLGLLQISCPRSGTRHQVHSQIWQSASASCLRSGTLHQGHSQISDLLKFHVPDVGLCITPMSQI